MNALFIKQLRLYQYKNYDEVNLSFKPILNAIVGKNGVGKTNVLDAIYTLSFTKSYFSKLDALSINHNCNICKVQAQYQLNDDAVMIDFTMRENNKKEIIHNGQIVKKFASFIGTIPIIMISPDDIELINGVAEIRRNFLDKFISQINHFYLDTLIRYNKILQQKNAILKEWHVQKNEILLEIYNQQLEPLGKHIFNIRTTITERLIAYTKQYYYLFSDSQYEINIKYYSQLKDKNWQTLIQDYGYKECIAQRNLIGIQKDELHFYLSSNLFKETASQGQKKTLLIALKLAELVITAEEKKIHPILLLDDIFEKLDTKRLQLFFDFLLKIPSLQIVLTDVNKQRVTNFLSPFNKPCNFIEF